MRPYASILAKAESMAVEPGAAADSNAHLFVDLDGTLIRTDLLFESLLLLIRRNPLYLAVIPFWLLKGRAWLKHQIARRVEIDPAVLPYNEAFLAWLGDQRARGRAMTLISASDQRYVSAVAEHVGLFDAAIGSDGKTNLKARNKLQRIEEIVQGSEFAYAGDSRADVPVWAGAGQILLVNCSPSISGRFENSPAEVLRFGSAPALFGPLLRAMRPHQWLKNTLLFVPLILSHQLFRPDLLFASAIGFVSFCLCASSVYLLNDMLDLDNDRAHQTKRKRPFASGELALAAGFAAAPALLIGAFLVSLLLPADFRLVLLIYWLLTCLYSFALKRIFLLDVATLAVLYAFRVTAGAEAIEVAATNFLIAFSLCFFLGLAMVKRVTELVNLQAAPAGAVSGRAYRKNHEPLLSVIGSLASLMAVVVFAFYINAPATTRLYGSPLLLWLICPLLIVLLGRIWWLARAGRLHEDPVLFAVEDRFSQMIVLATGVLIWLAA
ncbi:MAG: UbiA family prenyltransferase [Gammaproteobacteria bacterium]|nr:UbiA family prenyltransferase [Gammaproteobacteria bacterium]MYH85850.1 UbiA family prenyltransferase [Gammaproteobacteria bacterium]